MKRDYKAEFLAQITAAGLPAPQMEYYFALPARRWRFDYCWPDQKVACEYNGIFGVRNASHASITKLLRDYEKSTEANLLGYTIVTITARTVSNGQAIEWITRALQK